MVNNWNLPFIKLRSVGTKIFLLFFVSILIIVSALGYSSYTISRNVVTDKYTHSTEQTILQASQKINLLFGLYQALNLQITGNPRTKTDIGQFLENSLSQGELITILNRVKAELINARFTLPGIHSISLISVEDGTILYDGGNNPSFNPATDLHQQAWLKQVVQADGEPVWLETKSDAYVVEAMEPVFAVARLQPNYYANNQKSVICVIELNSSLLTDSLRQIDIGENGSVFMATPDNYIVYANELSEIGQSSPLYMKNKEASYTVLQDGDEQLVIHSPVEKSGWEVIGYVPLSVILEETNIIAQVTLIMAAIALIIACVIGYVAVRMFGRPLVNLRNLMQQGENGNLSVRMHSRRRDEIGDLSNSFNRMMVGFSGLLIKVNQTVQEVRGTASILSEASMQTSTSSNQIATVMQEMAEGASNLAVSAESGNHQTVDISLKTVDVLQANNSIGILVDEVQSVSIRGTQNMKKLLYNSIQTDELTNDMRVKVGDLKSSATSIRSIIDLLVSMSRQINILALNAGIEASRAGTAGRGFTVIANQIRALADQSNQSIQIIGDVTDSIQNDVDKTVTALTKAFPIFQEQTHAIQETAKIFQTVEDHMNGFHTQMLSVIHATDRLQLAQTVLDETMNNVSAVSQQTSASTQEVAALGIEQLDVSQRLVRLSDGLEQLSESLQESLTHFKFDQ